MIEVMGIRRRKRQQLPGDLKEEEGYCKLKEKTLDKYVK
jgi:hypothetical protein